MAQVHIVLDTNCFRGLGREDLDRVAGLGVPIRVSEIALGETWARSVKDYEAGTKDRRAARGLLFGRIRRLLPYLDEREPISFVGKIGLEILRADIAGTPWADLAANNARSRAFLRRAARPELSDEEWLAGAAEDFGPFLDNADAVWRDFNLPEELIWERRYVDPVKREADRTAWAETPLSVRYASMLAFVIESLGLSEVERVRSDAVVRMLAWRMMNASHRFGRANQNDGADNLLPQHVANGAILVTRDVAFLSAVEASGTVQGPWIRHLDEMLGQALPTCMPWEAGADAIRASFKRTSIADQKIEAARWVSTE